MYRIGIDIGSTYTKYCIMNSCGEIVGLYSEQTPVRQKEYFEKKRNELKISYPEAKIISCGYGRRNFSAAKSINELTALAAGVHRQNPFGKIVLDIGGQDTKVICQTGGVLKEFFINDKCAAGCGMFLANTLNMLQMKFEDIDLTSAKPPEIRLSSVCAVFAQSEIVELVAADVEPERIVQAVVWQILTQAKVLLGKVADGDVVLSGGLTQIKGIGEFAEQVFGRKVVVLEQGAYLAAIGCAVYMCV